MANSFYTIQLTSNNLAGNFLKVQVDPIGNTDKWSTTTFVNGATSNYYQCEIGTDIEQTIINLKDQLDYYYTGAGYTNQPYNTTIIATDTLKVELIEPYLDFEVFLFSGLEDNAILAIENVPNIKYYIEYNDSVNILHRFELYDSNYFESPSEVQGYVTMDYGQVDENLEAIRGQGLRVNLEADASLTFEELFEENEKTFKCIYYRNNVILFQGWLNPEGFFEDYVNDKWIVSFDCIDGLGYLKNLAFVNDDGTNITGVKSQLEILSLALRRTGIEVNINVDIDVFYTGLADTNSILENVKANTRRYIKDDEVTVMNCEEVIRDILEPYGAVLTSYNGRWAIYKPNQLVSNQTATFFRYDYLGVALSPTTITYDFDFTIGSQVDGYDPHYCNGNQQFTNQPSFGAYRISYKYGVLRSLIDNNSLLSNGTGYDDFVITDLLEIVIKPAGEYGFGLNVLGPGFKNSVINTLNYIVPSGSSFKLSLAYSFSNVSSSDLNRNKFVVRVDDDNTSNYYTLNTNGSWKLNGSFSTIKTDYSEGDTLSSYDLDVNNVPVKGTMQIRFYNPEDDPSTVNSGICDFTNISITSLDVGDEEGETWTFERTNNPSSRIEKTREVFTGDSEFNTYEGTLYKSDGITPTETWYRKGITEAVPVLELMGSEAMRMNANTMRIFNGDVFGYFNYLSVITIDGRTGKFGVTKYSYDTKSNIISAEFKQMFGDELTDLDVEKRLDYGNVVEPTIRG